jgi:tetratricopeptide (TPR) repeat protein
MMLRGCAYLVVLIAVVACAGTTPISSTDILNAEQAVLENRQNLRPLQAQYHAEAAAQPEGWTPSLRRAAGNLRRELGDLAGAIAHWEAIATTTDSQLLRDLAEAQFALARWADASDTLRRLLQITPTDAWVHLQLGLILAAASAADATVHLDTAAQEAAYATLAQSILDIYRSNPNEAMDVRLMRIGITLADQAQWAYAQLAFESALVNNPSLVEALAYAGLTRDQQGKDGGEAIRQAVAVAPRNALVRYLQALHLRMMGDAQGSLDAMAQAVALDPENVGYYAELGQAYRTVGDLVRAEYWLRTAVQMSGNAERFQALLTDFYGQEAGNLSGGALLLEGDVAQLPLDADVLAGFGWALYTQGSAEEGIAYIDDALQIAPQNVRALYYKARTQLDAGLIEVALPTLQAIAAGDSEFAGDAQAAIDAVGNEE